MLNSPLPLPIQIQTKQPVIHNTNLTHAGESGKAEGTSFDKVLEREVAQKKQATSTESNTTNTNNSDTESNGSIKDKTTTPSTNDASNTEKNSTESSSVKTGSNNEHKSGQKDEEVETGPISDNSGIVHAQLPQRVPVPAFSTDQPDIHANNTRLKQTSGITSVHLTVQSETQQQIMQSDLPHQNPWQSSHADSFAGIDSTDQPDIHANNTRLKQTSGITSVHLTVQSETQQQIIQSDLPDQNPWQSSYADSFAGIDKSLPLLNSHTHGLIGGNNLNKTVNLTNTAKNDSFPQFFTADVKQNLIENKELWQLLHAANFADNEKTTEFSLDTGKDFLARFNEFGAMIQTDSDTLFQPGLNNSSQIFSQTASQATVSQHVELDVQIGQPKWNGEFAQKIVWLANQQNQFAELRLNPAHLGPVEIMLSLTNDNGTQASAQFVSPHLAVREAIEAALPRLRELMAESGIQLGDVMVGAESFQQQEKSEQHARHANDNAGLINAQNFSDTIPEEVTSSGKHSGIVNTFA
ncbi:hook-length control protein FliK [Nitrosomonas marina]|uniref:Hook-length control protein FliK n=1 Tax=Nitrosomonas marina TaxID=917 RepID=A0A1H9YJN7_9PROT|nr:flagellar hook-length control protein FliK [Nitrosomonas marina]SES69281.1 hook-length control protein FliK [Nitrosomonas marina]